MKQFPRTVDSLMGEAFNRPRDPRSPEYKAGFRCVLEFRVNGTKAKMPTSFLNGTCAADAFFAGGQEAHIFLNRLASLQSQELPL